MQAPQPDPHPAPRDIQSALNVALKKPEELNFTGDLHGVQLGLLNFSGSGGAFVFPILNLGF